MNAKQKPQDLRTRTKEYALEIVWFYGCLPKTTEMQVLGKQVLRSGTSVGAQYREGQRAKSSADMISKFEGALQELDETAYWLELIQEIGKGPEERIRSLTDETNELMAMLVASVRMLKGGGRGEVEPGMGDERVR